MVWRNHQNFMTLKNPLYLCSMPKGENEDLLLLVVPKAHQIATLKGFIEMQDTKAMTALCPYYKNTFGGQGMVKQMRQSIRAGTHCLQYEGGFPKAPLCPNVATTPLDLLHVDFTSIETMLESN